MIYGEKVRVIIERKSMKKIRKESKIKGRTVQKYK